VCSALADRAKIGRTATDLVLVLVQLGVRGAVLAYLLLTLEASSEKVVRLETLQTYPACPCAARGLGGLRFPVNTQTRSIFQIHLLSAWNTTHLEKLTFVQHSKRTVTPS
jgi:hypothetical protein